MPQVCFSHATVSAENPGKKAAFPCGFPLKAAHRKGEQVKKRPTCFCFVMQVRLEQKNGRGGGTLKPHFVTLLWGETVGKIFSLCVNYDDRLGLLLKSPRCFVRRANIMNRGPWWT